MDIRYLENGLTAEALAGLRNREGWSYTLVPQAQKALDHSLYSVAAVRGEETVGMGRLIGDGALTWYVSDVIVIPECRGQHIGATIVRMLIDYAVSHSEPGTNIAIALMSARGKEPFYEKLGFYQRPNDHEGAGMMMRLKVPGGGQPAASAL